MLESPKFLQNFFEHIDKLTKLKKFPIYSAQFSKKIIKLTDTQKS